MPFIGVHLGLKYDIVGEMGALLIAVLLLVFMLLTKPRHTRALKYLYMGVITSIFCIILQTAIVNMATFTERYNRTYFTLMLIAFLVLFGTIMGDFYNYIYLMSVHTVQKRITTAAAFITAVVVYSAVIIYHLYMKNFYYVRTDGIDMAHFIRVCSISGIICLAIIFLYSTYKRKSISRVVMRGIYLVVPIDMIVLIIQLVDRSSIFISVTYVVPFLACYLLFHSNPYDEDTGCQNTSALESRLITNNRRGRIFYIAYIEFAQLLGNSRNLDYEGLQTGLAKTCREIEQISNKIHLYRINYGTFVAVLEVREKSDAENYAEKIRDRLDDFYHNNDHIHYFLGVGGDSRRFAEGGNKWAQYFMKYIREKHALDGQNVYYFANGDDFRDYNGIYKIEQALADIRCNMDPNDERILCYAQPIYSVEKDSFRSAEALMRMCIDGKMVPPDEFISIAERSNCIHALTVIMMHKVCKAVEKLSEEYDFDAVTINCSTSDFVDREFYKEIMDIIHSYHIDQKKIRLELTESMMADSYESVKHNMEMLNTEGIQLYMDDFGTGYSNLERVLDVPVQTIKFDKSLLYKSIQDDRVGDIISYMIDIFKKNGFITLVEGVEDEKQKNYSINRGFDYIQGYHYAKPMPIDALSKYFKKR